MKASKVSGTYGLQLGQPSPYAWFNTSGKNGSPRRHCMQEIKAVSSDSNRNHGVPSQYAHPEINFTRGPASWEKGKTLLAQKNMDCVLIYSWLFLMNVQFSLHAINRILFQTHLLTCKCHPVSFSVITTIIGSCTSTPTPKLNYAWPRELGKNFVGAKRNRLGVYLFVKFFKKNWVFNSHCAQSRRFCSKRIFLLVHATQLDLALLQLLSPVLAHPPPN